MQDWRAWLKRFFRNLLAGAVLSPVLAWGLHSLIDWMPTLNQPEVMLAQIPSICLAWMLWETRGAQVWQNERVLPLRGRWLCAAFCLVLPVAWFFFSFPVYVRVYCH